MNSPMLTKSMKYGCLQGPIAPNLMGLAPHDVAIV